MNLSQLRQELLERLHAIDLVQQMLHERTKHEQVKKTIHWTQDPKNRRKMLLQIKRMRESKK